MIPNTTKYIIRSVVNPSMDCKILASTQVKMGDTVADKVTAEAVFQKCDVANANGMSFSRNVLAKALRQIEPEIESRHFLGELDHPDDISDINRIATVSLKNVSHVITKLVIDGNYVVGKFETLLTPIGITLAALLRDNIKIGVSIRAVTDQDVSYSTNSVDDIRDFSLISYDAVHNPAYSDAFVRTLVASVILQSDGTYKARPLDDIKLVATQNDLITITASEFKAYTENLTKIVLENIYKNKRF